MGLTVTEHVGITRSAQRGPQIASGGGDDTSPLHNRKSFKKRHKNNYINTYDKKGNLKDKVKRKSINHSLIHGDKLSNKEDGTTRLAVSYTHLTLPTMRTV